MSCEEEEEEGGKLRDMGGKGGGTLQWRCFSLSCFDIPVWLERRIGNLRLWWRGKLDCMLGSRTEGLNLSCIFFYECTR